MTKTFNPVLYAVIGIPLATVVAGFATLYFAIQSNGYELPAEYAWEGAALDADLARADTARALQVGVTVSVLTDGRVLAQLSGFDSTALPDTLRLTLTHATLPHLDQTRELHLLDRSSRRYGAEGIAIPEGTWWIEVADGSLWRLRAKASSLAQPLQLGVTP
jgi:hypothetical protein